MLPNLIVIGAMKAATSSLHYYLSLHPEIYMSADKELDFFIAELSWAKGVDWYQSHFRSGAKIRGESSPNYTAYPLFPGVAERMQGLLPDARLIYVVRDPIERMISHYVHSLNRRRESRPAEQAFADEESIYFQRSRYHMQLQQFAPFYDKAQLLVVSSEGLRDDRRQTLREVFRFLDVDETFDTPDFDRIIHDSRAKRTLSPTGRAVLRLYHWMKPLVPAAASLKRIVSRGQSNPLYAEIERPVLSVQLREQIAASLANDVAQLRAYTGMPFAEWSL